MRGFANERDLTPLVSEGRYPRRAHTRRQPLADVRFSRNADAAREIDGARAGLGLARRTLDRVGGLGWSVIGFLLGAVFWHFVGFWTFVSEVVLAGDPSDRTADRPRPFASVANDAPMPAGAQDAALMVGAWCTALALDRKTGLTSVVVCPNSTSPGPAIAAKPREDRIVADSNTWGAPDTPARAAAPRRR